MKAKETVFDIQKLKEFITSKHALQDMLNDLH